jgi:predicted GH43/DUF377 family glycosyl hydrolase
MASHEIMQFSSLILRPDPGRTVMRPFSPDDPASFADPSRPRAARIVERVLALDTAGLEQEHARILSTLNRRHRYTEGLLLPRFEEINLGPIDKSRIGRDHALLIGAYFSEEYSFEAAALFNPSIVPHPDQSGVEEGAIRFILSLRGIGEGHISSVTFRTGTWGADGNILVDSPSSGAVPPEIDRSQAAADPSLIRLNSPDACDISELVLFPLDRTQLRGMEDLRLTRFTEEDGRESYVGTFTAFDGRDVHTVVLTTRDFRAFEARPIRGDVAASKGMALFPRRIGGRYAMLGRQDNENIWLLTSDDLTTWNGGRPIVQPRWPWEFVQIGNCGSPIELDEGWLVLTHGVGAVRNYCMGACLLDKDDPAKVLARLPRPLIEPSEKDRDGYVPNIIYSCGALLQGRRLLIPYGVADNFTAFATTNVDQLLAAMV